jgi:hypothetical protein
MRKIWDTKEKRSMFGGNGSVQTLCNLYTFVFFMVFFSFIVHLPLELKKVM